MDISNIVEAWSNADTESDLFGHLQASLGQFGFDQFNYVRFRRAMGPFDPYSFHLTWPEHWIEYCITENHAESDPVLDRLQISRRTIDWDEVEADTSLAPAQIGVMSDARAVGMHNGLTVPFHGPRGEVGAFALSKSTKSVTDSIVKQTSVMLCHYFHSVYSSFDTDELNAPMEPRLTEREREVLLWCAEGKSNWSIGEILGISEHSVKFHVQNIYRKLDANSRIAAVVKAIRIGLIQP